MIKLVELFGGLGSFRKALENLGYKVDCDYVENEKQAVRAYNQIYNTVQGIRDIKDYSYTDDKKIDILTAGFPCQDISQAGKRNLEKGRSLLYKEIIRIVAEIPTENRPDYIILENSNKLFDKCNQNILYDIKLNFKKLGYNFLFKEFDSNYYGIPMTRKRAIGIFTLQTVFFDEMKKIISNETWDINNTLNKYLSYKYETVQYRSNEFKFYDYYCVPINKEKNSCYYRIYNNHTNQLGSIRASYRTKIYYNNLNGILRIRKLYAYEAFKLFGWSDSDYNKLATMSESRKWKLIANSITLPVLENIFKYLELTYGNSV